jgi:hypothetical protein
MTNLVGNVCPLKGQISKSKGFKRFPILDILASVVVAIGSIMSLPIQGSAIWGLAGLIGFFGFVMIIGQSGRHAPKSLEEKQKNIMFGLRMILISIISSILIWVFLQLYVP